MSVIPGDQNDLLISMYYGGGPGTDWATMTDNDVLGWQIDETGAAEPVPVIIGALTPTPPNTAPIVSPQWISVRGTTALIPDTWRGQLDDLFDYLAFNNGADRKLGANFLNAAIVNAWQAWANAHPTQIYDETATPAAAPAVGRRSP